MAMVVGLLSVILRVIATVMVEGDDDHVVNVVTFATFTIDWQVLMSEVRRFSRDFDSRQLTKTLTLKFER